MHRLWRLCARLYRKCRFRPRRLAPEVGGLRSDECGLLPETLVLHGFRNVPALIPEFVYDMVYERQGVAPRSFLVRAGR